MFITFKELTDISKFSKAEAWLLVTSKLLQASYWDMNVVKKGILLKPLVSLTLQKLSMQC
jgi:hypothetical protein